MVVSGIHKKLLVPMAVLHGTKGEPGSSIVPVIEVYVRCGCMHN